MLHGPPENILIYDVHCCTFSAHTCNYNDAWISYHIQYVPKLEMLLVCNYCNTNDVVSNLNFLGTSKQMK